MSLRRPPSAAIVCVLALAAAAATGCGGEEPREDEAEREGLSLELGGLEYNVYITRQLNLRDPEDRGYYQGPEAPPGSTHYGVFLQVCNPSNTGPPRRSAASFSVVDTQGNEFEPVELEEDNVFAYQPRALAPRECIPQEGSLAASSPTAGAMLLFRLPLEATENRPLELEIEGVYNAMTGERQTAAVELDL